MPSGFWGRPDQAVRYHHGALAIRPDTGIWHDLGASLYDAGDFAGAEAASIRAIELDPDFAEAHNNLGTVFLARNELDQAIEEFQTAIKLKTDFAASHSNLGIAFRRLGDLDSAIDSGRMAVEIDPQDASFSRNLGNALALSGDLTSAMAAFYPASRVDVDDSEVQLEDALLRKYTGNLESYRRLCEWMFERYSDSDDESHIHRLLVVHLLFPGKARPELLNIARRHTAGGPPEYVWLLNLAHYRLGEDSESLPTLEPTVLEGMHPHSRISYLLSLALLQLDRGQMEEARKSVRRRSNGPAGSLR